MNILLAFLPFLVFAVVDRTIGVTEGLVAGAVTSLAMLVHEVLVLRRSPKILELGTLLLFGGLAIYAFFGNPGWTLMEVRLRVDLGLLAIVLVSLAIPGDGFGRPVVHLPARYPASRRHSHHNGGTMGRGEVHGLVSREGQRPSEIGAPPCGVVGRLSGGCCGA